MSNLFVSAPPHITNKKNTTRRIMIDVLISLFPVLVVSIFFFGWHVLLNAVVCMGACFSSELLFNLIQKKKFSKENVKTSTVWDFSSLVTGLILALVLPSKLIVKEWDFNVYADSFTHTSANAADHIIFSGDVLLVGILGSIFAIFIVKMLFGGIGKNFVNPAVGARVFILISFSIGIVNTLGVGFRISSGATWLSTASKSTSNQSMFLNYFLGNRGTSAVGETSIAAIIIGYLYLSIRKVIDFRLPLIIVASAVLFALIFESAYKGSPARVANSVFMNILSGGLVFGAVFMATDYSSSPNTFIGQAIFGVGIGFFVIIIRNFTPMAEGMSFAILLMNVATPLIDKYVYPKPFGYVKPKKTKKTVENPSIDKLNKNNHTDKNNSEVSA